MLYRALCNLQEGDRVIPVGSIFEREYKPSVLSVLFEVGAIAEIVPPPLAILPGWAVRSARLAEIGINDVAEFLQGDVDVIAARMRCASSLVERWMQEVRVGLLAVEQAG